MQYKLHQIIEEILRRKEYTWYCYFLYKIYTQKTHLNRILNKKSLDFVNLYIDACMREPCLANHILNLLVLHVVIKTSLFIS